jgi:hypothetical protein
MSTVRDLLASLGIDISEYKSGLKDAEGDTNAFERVVSGLGVVGGGILASGMAAGVAGTIALGAELVRDVQAAAEAQEAQVLLQNTLRNTGGVTGVTAALVNGLANQYSLMTRYEDDVIVSAGGVLARFKEINSDAFPEALVLSMDLANSLGIDLPNAARMVGMALAKPGEGLLRLKQAGVVFTDQEEEMIAQMVAAGDTAGAQALIMDALKGSIGGAAEAAGSTAAGQWTIFQNQITGIRETIGGALLPALTSLGEGINTYLSKPETQKFIQGIATAIGEFAQKVVAWLPTALTWIKNAFGWLSENRGLIIGALVAIGVAIAVFVYTTVIPAAIAIITATWPIILAILAIVAVVWLVYEAWTNNWLGIKDALMGVWNAIQPVLQQLWTWIQVHVATAVSNLSIIWNTVLLPALQAVWQYIATVLWPIFVAIAGFLGAVFGAVIKVLAGIWQNILLPVLTVVWNFIANTLWPLFQAIGGFIGAVFNVVFTILAGIWQNVVLPALQAVAKWLGEKLQPAWKLMSDFINDKVMPILKTVGEFLGTILRPIFDAISTAISTVIGWITSMTDALNNITLPDWLTPGSPTPFEIGLLGIADALDAVSRKELPSLAMGLNVLPEALSMSGENAAGMTGAEGFSGAMGSGSVYVTITNPTFLGTDPYQIAQQLEPAFDLVLHKKGLK